MPPSSLFSPSPAARDNIWWLFCHFSPFSPEFCLPDKAMIFNRGLIEPSHVLLCPTQLAHRQPHRGCAFICLGLTKRKHFDKRRENKGERLTKRKEAASVCLPSDVCDESSESVSWALSWRERATQLFAKVIAVLAQINQASLYKQRQKIRQISMLAPSCQWGWENLPKCSCLWSSSLPACASGWSGVRWQPVKGEPPPLDPSSALPRPPSLPP